MFLITISHKSIRACYLCSSVFDHPYGLKNGPFCSATENRLRQKDIAMVIIDNGLPFRTSEHILTDFSCLLYFPLNLFRIRLLFLFAMLRMHARNFVILM